jgi:probable HAF family extracellular repeat protein
MMTQGKNRRIAGISRLILLSLVGIFSPAARTASAQALTPGDIVIGANIGVSSTNPDWGLLEIDPATGNRTIISDATHGTGPALPPATGVSIESDGSLLVTWGGLGSTGSLYRVDPATGDRTVISSVATNTGPTSNYVCARQFGSDILLSGGPIVSVDPATGNRTLVSGAGLGSGPSFSSLGFVEVGTSLYAVDAGGSILKIDTLTGDRIVVSSSTVGTGTALTSPAAIELDHAGNLLVTTSSPANILSIDPVTGNRTIVTGSTVGTGPSIGTFPGDFGVAANGTLYIGQESPILSQRPLLSVDPITGNRTIISDATHGTGPLFQPTLALAMVPGVPEPSTIVLALFGGLVLTVRYSRRCFWGGLAVALLASAGVARAQALSPGDIVITAQIGPSDYGLVVVDPTTGNRTILSDNTTGTGPDFSNPEGVTIEPDGNLLVSNLDAHGDGSIFRVDPATGNRTILSGVTHGTVVDLYLSYGIVETGGTIYVGAAQSILAVDPTSGHRTYFSGTVGTGPTFSSPFGLAVDGPNLLVADEFGKIIQVDLSTGNRTSSFNYTGTTPAYTVGVTVSSSGTVLVSAQSGATSSIPGVYSVNFLTQTYSLVSGGSVGSGPQIGASGPTGIATESNGTILLEDVSLNSLLSIDPTTGNRTILSDATHGTGPLITAPQGMLVIPSVPEPSTIVLALLGGLVLVRRYARRIFFGALVATLLASAPIARAQTLSPGDIIMGAVISANGFQTTDAGLFVVDPTTGNRTILSDNTHGTGPDFTDPTGVSFASDGSLLVTDNEKGTLFRVDPATGNRTIISSTYYLSPVGTGPTNAFEGARQFGSDIVLSGGSVLNVDPATGDRSLIPGGGSSASFSSVGFVESGTDLILANSSLDEIQRLDTITGNLTVLSSATVGGGASFSNSEPLDVEYDNAGQLLVSIFLGPILRIDPSTGNRTIVSGSGVGSGPSLGAIGAGQIGVAADGTIFYGGFDSNTLLQIDPTTGNRAILSDATHGTGPGFYVLTAACAVVPNVPEPSTIILVLLGGLIFVARRHSRRIFLGVLATTALMSSGSGTALGDSFQGLPFITGQSGATGVTADGSIIVGASQTGQPFPSTMFDVGIEWINGVMMPLDNLPNNGYLTAAEEISGDGSTILGGGFNNSVPGPSNVLLKDGNLTPIGELSSNGGVIPAGISYDGSVVVGQARDSNGNAEAFRWDNGVMTGLGDLPGVGSIPFSEATGVSADGSVVVGHGLSAASSYNEAFRWVSDGMGGGTMSPLGFLPGENSSVALAVSADGNVAVGYGGTNGFTSASLMWKDGTITNLGLPPGYTSTQATAVSGDGSVIVGWNTFGTSNFNHQVYLWTQATGMVPLQSYLLAHGVSSVNGWTLYMPYAISADGRTIVGDGYNPQGQLVAWSATIPEPSAILLALLGGALLLWQWRRTRAALTTAP